MSIDIDKIFHTNIKGLLTGSSFKIVLNILIVAIVWISLKIAWPFNPGSAFFNSLARFLIIGSAGLGIYIGLAFLMRLPEPLKLYNMLAGKFRKAGNSA